MTALACLALSGCSQRSTHHVAAYRFTANGDDVATIVDAEDWLDHPGNPLNVCCSGGGHIEVVARTAYLLEWHVPEHPLAGEPLLPAVAPLPAGGEQRADDLGDHLVVGNGPVYGWKAGAVTALRALRQGEGLGEYHHDFMGSRTQATAFDRDHARYCILESGQLTVYQVGTNAVVGRRAVTPDFARYVVEVQNNNPLRLSLDGRRLCSAGGWGRPQLPVYDLADGTFTLVTPAVPPLAAGERATVEDAEWLADGPLYLLAIASGGVGDGYTRRLVVVDGQARVLLDTRALPPLSLPQWDPRGRRLLSFAASVTSITTPVRVHCWDYGAGGTWDAQLRYPAAADMPPRPAGPDAPAAR